MEGHGRHHWNETTDLNIPEERKIFVSMSFWLNDLWKDLNESARRTQHDLGKENKTIAKKQEWRLSFEKKELVNYSFQKGTHKKIFHHTKHSREQVLMEKWVCVCLLQKTAQTESITTKSFLQKSNQYNGHNDVQIQCTWILLVL